MGCLQSAAVALCRHLHLQRPAAHLPRALCLLPTAAAEYSLAEPYQALGSKLSIQLPPGLKAGDTVAVGISFETSPQASAVQW